MVLIGVMKQARYAPNLGIAAVLGCRRPHYDFHGAGAGQQGGIGGPGLKLSKGLVTGHGHGAFLPFDFGTPCSTSGRRQCKVLRWPPTGATGLGRSCLLHDSPGSGDNSLRNVLLDVLPSQAETGTDWRSRVFGIDGAAQLRGHYNPFQAIEVRYAAFWRGTEVNGFRQSATLLIGQVGFQGRDADRLPLRTATGAIVGCMLWFSDEGFVHWRPQRADSSLTRSSAMIFAPSAFGSNSSVRIPIWH